MKQEKLVGVIHELTMGGAERMMVNILNHFVSQNREVHLIIFKNIGTLMALLHKDIVVHDLKSSSVKKSMPMCLKKLYELQPDTVFSGIGHVNIAMTPFIPLMRLLMPQTRWISRETNIVSMQNQEGKYPWLFDWLYRNFYKNYDVIIAQSKDMQNDLMANYPSCAKKSLVINNPIDIERVEVLAEEFIDFTVESDKINLVSVGTLRARKRQDLLLKVFAKLPSNYRLVIVGSGEEEQKLKSLTVTLGIEKKVTFTGHQTNPYPYMKKADLFLLSSEHEGFPNVLLEANSLGIPLVAYACPGGINEIIEEGVNGYSVINGDVDKMVFMVQKAIKHGFSKKEVQNSVKKRYSHDIILKKYEEVFYGTI